MRYYSTNHAVRTAAYTHVRMENDKVIQYMYLYIYVLSVLKHTHTQSIGCIFGWLVTVKKLYSATRWSIGLLSVGERAPAACVTRTRAHIVCLSAKLAKSFFFFLFLRIVGWSLLFLLLLAQPCQSENIESKRKAASQIEPKYRKQGDKERSQHRKKNNNGPKMDLYIRSIVELCLCGKWKLSCSGIV